MRVAVLGAGVVGLACAEELLRGGHDVRVYDPRPALGATHAAAGMLAPAGEAWHGEGALLALGLESAAQWPEYAARVTALSGADVGLRTGGTLLVGQDRDDLALVRRTLDVLAGHGVPFEELDGRALRRREPTLARVAGGAFVPGDHSVDPRRLAGALLRVVGDRLVRAAAQVVDGELVLDGGERIETDAVVVATGAAARGFVPWVRPVKGETIRLRAGDPPGTVLRGHVHGRPVYVVPRADGEVVVGATEEEHATSPVASVGAVVRLLDAARVLVPGLETADVVEITARNRPGSPDNGPALGLHGPAAAGPRTVLAVGHYRSGVLLAPVTARVVRAYVEGGPVPEVARPFTPDRFAAPLGPTPGGPEETSRSSLEPSASPERTSTS